MIRGNIITVREITLIVKHKANCFFEVKEQIVSLFLFLSSHLIDGFLIMYQGITISDKRGITAGISLVFVKLINLVTSIFYNNAICTLDTKIFANTVVLLFLNDLDEKIHSA